MAKMDAMIYTYMHQTHSWLDFNRKLTRYCIPVTVHDLLGMLSRDLEFEVIRVWVKAERRRGKKMWG